MRTAFLFPFLLQIPYLQCRFLMHSLYSTSNRDLLFTSQMTVLTPVLWCIQILGGLTSWGCTTIVDVSTLCTYGKMNGWLSTGTWTYAHSWYCLNQAGCDFIDLMSGFCWVLNQKIFYLYHSHCTMSPHWTSLWNGFLRLVYSQSCDVQWIALQVYLWTSYFCWKMRKLYCIKAENC